MGGVKYTNRRYAWEVRVHVSDRCKTCVTPVWLDFSDFRTIFFTM